MNNFDKFQTAVYEQMCRITEGNVFRVDTDANMRNTMWELYLSKFPKNSNPIHKTRTEHDCQCCKQFIRTAGGMVGVTGNSTLMTIWDIDIGGPYQVVANAMAQYVRKFPIANVYYHYEKQVGTPISGPG